MPRYIRNRQKYSSPIVKLPKPEFYVLYNGSDTWNKEYLKLSDAFEANSESDTYVELVAKVVNIKPETATVDIKADDELYVYATFVSQVQTALDDGDSIFTALKKVREYCLGLGVSSSMLDKWKWRYGRDDLDMYLEEFDYLDDVKRQSYIKGEAKKTLETVKNALSEGLPFDLISRLCGLSVDKIREIAQT